MGAGAGGAGAAGSGELAAAGIMSTGGSVWGVWTSAISSAGHVGLFARISG